VRRYSHFTHVTGRGRVQIEPLAWWSWSTGAVRTFTRRSTDSNTATMAKTSPCGSLSAGVTRLLSSCRPVMAGQRTADTTFSFFILIPSR
jgi:hypothetical protein